MYTLLTVWTEGPRDGWVPFNFLIFYKGDDLCRFLSYYQFNIYIVKHY